MYHSRLISTLLFAIVCLVSVAQSIERVQAEMDEVKLSDRYIYGEGFDMDMNNARAKALDDMVNIINECRLEQSLRPISIDDINDLSELITLQYVSKDVYYAMTYIDRSLAMGLQPKTMITPSNKTQGKSPAPTNTTINNTPAVNDELSESLTDITEIISNQDTWLEIKPLLTKYKGQGLISVGNTQDLADVPSDAVIILFDDLAGVLSILSPKDFAHRINYRTNTLDTETNHRYTFIVWYK